MRYILFLLSLCPAIAYSQSPSFDCGKAETDVEHEICGNTYLASLDWWLNEIYFALLPTTRGQLSPVQQNWIRKRNGCEVHATWELSDCLVNEYEAQIIFLSEHKERQEGLISISGTYNLTSEVYRDKAQNAYADTWEVKVFVRPSVGNYLVFAKSTVGVEYDTCTLVAEAQRIGDSLRLSQVFDEFNPFAWGRVLDDETVFAIDIAQNRAEFLDFDSWPFCYGSAFLSLESGPLVFFKVD